MISGNKYQINELLLLPESEFMDFKESYHDNRVRLLHDVLCLANAPTTNDRFLIFGVRDDRTVVTVTNDPNRKRQIDILTLLRDSRINILPTVRLDKHTLDGNEVDVLVIFNRPEKPYFVLEDKTYQGVTARAGVVYSRAADTNTPIDRCIDDQKLEQMFRERFRLDKSPLERLIFLLTDKEKWKYYHEGNLTYFYHVMSPEFRIAKEDGLEGFDESWTEGFPDPSTHRYSMKAKYFDTILYETTAVALDGARMIVVVPERKVHRPTDTTFHTYYYFTKDSFKFALKEMVEVSYPQNQTFYNQPFNYFDTQAQAEAKIDQHIGEAANSRLIFFEKTDGQVESTRIER